MKDRRELYPYFASLEISRLFLLLYRHFPNYPADSGKTNSSDRIPADVKPMQKALRYIEENYMQDISLSQISEESNLSRFYFSRLFRKTTGMNFNNYLNRFRIEKAEEKIRTTRKPIIEIAYETGFSSIRTFNRSFRSIMECNPQSLRLK